MITSANLASFSGVDCFAFLNLFVSELSDFSFFHLRGLRPDAIYCNQIFYLPVPISKEDPTSLWAWDSKSLRPLFEPGGRFLPKRTCFFSLPTGEVIKAWDVAVATMKVGEVCHITCKPEYAYGSAGSPPKIPPNATLVFEVSVQPQRARQRANLISAQSLAALQPFLLPGDNVAKAEGLPSGEGRHAVRIIHCYCQRTVSGQVSGGGR